jgi:uncharacterized CHY-type Zn-finger protein
MPPSVSRISFKATASIADRVRVPTKPFTSTPMASEQGPLSAAPTTAATRPNPSASPFTTTASLPDPDTGRSNSRKRSRPDHSQERANPSATTHTARADSPSSKSPRLKGAFTPGVSAVLPLTAAPVADGQRTGRDMQRRQLPPTTENPRYKPLTAPMAGTGYGISRTEDAPVATAVLSDGMAAAANAIANPHPMQSDDKPEMSPASATSLASLGSPAQTATASPTMMASPGPMSTEGEGRDPRPAAPSQLQPPAEDFPPHRGALSYPGMLAPSDLPRPSRGLSLPMPGQNQSIAPRSPSQKKYQCPDCDTEFTRQHNLKSHRLTHSHEKPFVCQDCEKRFRRLHDLKRHSKLHTGERPHVCPKCDRRFARGDALARHAKGQGGCAGRRASMGSYGGDDDYEGSPPDDADENGMDGIMYSDGTRQNEADMTEEERRRFSLPTITAQHVSGSQDNYAQRPHSTYPPAGPRSVPNQATGGGLYPPNTDRAGTSSGSRTSPSLQTSNASQHSPGGNLSFSSGGTSIFPQSGMIESPGPLSPGAMASHQLGQDPSLSRQRSPSLNTQFQHQHFSRHLSDRASPTNMSLPSPHPKLPGIPGLGPLEQRYNAPGQGPNQQTTSNGGQAAATSPSTMYQAPMVLNSGRSAPIGPSHQQGNASSDASNNLFASGERGVWAYVHTLEDKVKQLSDKVLAMEAEKKIHHDQVASQQEQITQLSEELLSLRGNTSTQNQAQRPPASGPS